MLISGLFAWWYGAGYQLFVAKLWSKLGDTADFYSILSLLKTLFAPYRQIAVSETGISIDAKILALLDRLVSRLVGGFTRIFIILFGLIVLFLQIILLLFSLILWPLLPFTPLLFIVLTISGVSL